MTTTGKLLALAALLAAAPLAHASPATNVARNAYTNPDDNNDPSKSMKWNGGAPQGYGVYQANALSAKEDHPQRVVINGAGRYAAETTPMQNVAYIVYSKVPALEQTIR